MPRFEDENDFTDRELLREPMQGVGRGSLTQLLDREIGNLPVNGPLTVGPAQRMRASAQTADPFPSARDADDAGGARNPFVSVVRPDDARRQVFSGSKRWPSALSGAPARLQLSGFWRPVFARPDTVVPCIERATRREVLFAKRKAGGGGSRRKKRRSVFSTFRC